MKKGLGVTEICIFQKSAGRCSPPPSRGLCRVKTAMLFHENGIYIFPIDWNILQLDSELLHAYRKFSSESFEIVPEDFLKYQLFGKLNEPAVLNVFRVIHGNSLSFTNRMYGLLEKLLKRIAVYRKFVKTLSFTIKEGIKKFSLIEKCLDCGLMGRLSFFNLSPRRHFL